MVDENIIAEKVKHRKAKIETYAASAKVPSFIAALFVDDNAPITTNKKMLAEAGYEIDNVTEDNFRDVIYALERIGVIVLTNNNTDNRIASVLNTIINEEVPECWGGPDLKEYIDISEENL
jgi:homoserine dehydrogenase